MKKYLIILMLVVLTIVYMEFKFNRLENEITRSTLFISDTLDIMYSD